MTFVHHPRKALDTSLGPFHLGNKINNPNLDGLWTAFGRRAIRYLIKEEEQSITVTEVH